MNLFSGKILDQCELLFAEISSMQDDDRMDVINAIRLLLHKISPLSSEPVDCVLWVKLDQVKANDYNPNSVAPPEMKLLAHSIAEDGYTQPIVTWMNEGMYEVVDGYHRNRVGREIPEVRERIKGYLPVTVVNSVRTDRGDRIASTIRHNRARGKHRIDAMSDIVVELKRRNWSDEKIGRELGMDPDEVLRLTQITGLAEMFADRDFSKAWVAEESLEIKDDDRLDINEENISPLPVVGGLAGRDVQGNPVSDSSISDRRGSENSPDSGIIADVNEASREGMADSVASQSDESAKKPSGVDGTISLFSGSDHSGLPYETCMAHANSKPAGRSKRRGRFSDKGV